MTQFIKHSLQDINNTNLSSLKQYQYALHLAPEVNDIQDYTHLSDIYSCGITLYRLVNGDIYLPQISPIDVKALSQQGKYPDRKKHRGFIPRSLKMVIKKALNPNPVERFQSAEAMRNAIQQLSIETVWEEAMIQNGILWKGQNRHNYYEVKIQQEKNNSWIIETRKGSNPSSLRKITKFCKNNLTEKQANSTSSKIMQNFVTGKA